MIIDASFLINSASKQIFNALGVENSYFVGGCVRDIILGRKIFDIDIATPLCPTEIINALENANIRNLPTGFEHGTISAIIDKTAYEITSFRKDVLGDGRHALVEFTKNINEDAKRRDFTINALYCKFDGSIIDPTGYGIDDLAAKIIRFVGNPTERIQEDYLRILRFFRFYSQLETFSIDESGCAACFKFAPKIPTLSRERIYNEISKILIAPNAINTLKFLDKGAILSLIIGKNYDLPKFQIYYDNVKNLGQKTDFINALSAILPINIEIMMQIYENLRLSKQELKRLIAVCKLCDFLTKDFSIASLKKTAYKFGKSTILDFLLSKIENCADKFMAINEFEIPVFPIKSEFLFAKGLKSGPKMGRVLQNLEEKWIENYFIISENEIEQIIESIG
jgi:poly(A) polymerase